ncbi:MAG: hypothetical protein ACLSIL_15225 [Enterococcus casseliflavus]
MQEVGVRRAIAHAIDVESIIQTVHMGIGTQMSGPINELVLDIMKIFGSYSL